MSSGRLRFNRTLFTSSWALEATLIEQLSNEDIELILDARTDPEGAPVDRLRELCNEAKIYYVRDAELPTVLGCCVPAEEPESAVAARLALRHRTCLLAEEATRHDLAATVAEVVGMRVLDVSEHPAAIELEGINRIE